MEEKKDGVSWFFKLLWKGNSESERRKMEAVVFYYFMTQADSNTKNLKSWGNQTNYLKISE